MKCVVNLSDKLYFEWIENFLPGICPTILPVIGKPIIEYFIDFCTINNIKEMLWLVPPSGNNKSTIKYLKNANLWGVDITIISSEFETTEEDVLYDYSDFIGSGSVLYINKFLFPLYDKTQNRDDFSVFMSTKDIKIFNDVDEGTRLSRLDAIYINDIKDYYRLNMSLLRAETPYLYMAGYACSESEYIGMNVSIHPQSVLKNLLYIGNNVKVFEGSWVQNSIICSNCVIDTKTRIIDSIILDESYVGEALFLNKKIVFKETIIDPISGIKISLEDDKILSKTRGNVLKELFLIFIKNAKSLISNIINAFSFIFTKVFFRKKKIFKDAWAKECDSKKNYEEMSFEKFSLNNNSILGVIYLSHEISDNIVLHDFFCNNLENIFCGVKKLFIKVANKLCENIKSYNKWEN